MTLLGRSLMAGLFILALLALRPLLRRRAPAWLFPALWTLVALRLVFAPAVSLPVLPGAGAPFAGGWIAIPKAALTAEPPVAAAAAPVAVGITHTAVSPWVLLWAAGVAGSALLFLCGYIRTLLRCRSARPAPGIALPGRLWQPVRVLVSETATTPYALGIFRPTIVLPSVLLRPGEGRLQAILAHETAHIRHGDLLIKALLAVAVCLHWFNPLAWMMLRQANLDMEMACDEAAVRGAGRGERAAYAGALLDFAAVEQPFSPLATPFGVKPIEERIQRIMTANMKRKAWPATVLALILVLAVGCALATAPVEKTAAMDPYAGNLDWTSGGLKTLADLGMEIGPDNYGYYEGKFVGGVYFPAGNGGHWFQQRWNAETGAAEAVYEMNLADVVFLEVVYEGENPVGYTPINEAGFKVTVDTKYEQDTTKRQEEYERLGYASDHYQGKYVAGIYDEGNMVGYRLNEDGTIMTVNPEASGEAGIFLIARYEGETLVRFDEISLEEFSAIPMVASVLALQQGNN